MLAIVTLLVGCSSWIDQAPACQKDVYEWSDDLLAHILTGPGDGTFDYDPEDVPRQSIKGSYDLETGDFSWDVAYADSYWLSATKVEGYGTVYHDGDLDLLYTAADTDVLAVTSRTNYRVTRSQCEMTVSSWTAADESDRVDHKGSYVDDDGYSWAGSDGTYDYQGGMRRNLSHTFGATAVDGSYDVSVATKPEGTADTTLTSADEACYDAGYTCSASWKTRFDGGRDGNQTIRARDGGTYATISFSDNYDGSGAAHWVFADGTTCDTESNAQGACAYTCSDGTEGSC